MVNLLKGNEVSAAKDFARIIFNINHNRSRSELLG